MRNISMFMLNMISHQYRTVEIPYFIYFLYFCSRDCASSLGRMSTCISLIKISTRAIAVYCNRIMSKLLQFSFKLLFFSNLMWTTEAKSSRVYFCEECEAWQLCVLLFINMALAACLTCGCCLQVSIIVLNLTWQFNQIFWGPIIDLPSSGQINDLSLWGILLSSLPSSNFPDLRFFLAYTVLPKGTQPRRVCCLWNYRDTKSVVVGAQVPDNCQEKSRHILIVRLLKTHLFLLFQKLERPMTPSFWIARMVRSKS